MPCDVKSAHVLIWKDIEKSLAMGKLYEDMPFESARKGDNLFMDLVDKCIIELEDQGCIKLACICREWFDMDTLEERDLMSFMYGMKNYL